MPFSVSGSSGFLDSLLSTPRFGLVNSFAPSLAIPFELDKVRSCTMIPPFRSSDIRFDSPLPLFQSALNRQPHCLAQV